MNIHIHLHEHSDPAQVAALNRIAEAVEKVADQGDLDTSIKAATARLKAVNLRTAATVAAHPDPDPTA